MADPLRDPRFPHRPQSPDFWRIIEIVNQDDAYATEDGLTFAEVANKDVDPKAVGYIAVQRAILRQQKSGQAVDSRVTEQLASMWMDAFYVGLRFQQEGGHRAG